MKSIVEKIKEDLRMSIQKFETYRNSKDFKNYRSMADTICSMTDIVIDYCRENKGSYDTSMLNYIKCISDDLNKEAEKLNVIMSETLKKDEIRLYRDLVISLGKLLSVSSKIKSHVPTSVWKENSISK